MLARLLVCIDQSVHKNSPLFCGLSFCSRRLKLDVEVKSVCVKVCVCVRANWTKWGVAMGVAYCKKDPTFLKDSHTCTRFSAKVGHEPKDS